MRQLPHLPTSPLPYLPHFIIHNSHTPHPTPHTPHPTPHFPTSQFPIPQFRKSWQNLRHSV
ncbi:MAG: hypothetical protein GPI91_22360 [Microcystis aeruginosa K13-10]|uniref:hypothetical protein n=1 Tax=unclassified Microcystis TaxID=2643300 RepID=UPI0022C0C59B|nr:MULTISPECIES: hypothetical protein [unclassified Microcystis]MCZ8047297.1 hypothetical protein [Microcystis sp. LE19-41.2A]NCR82499.1 hypothetical protein [Microcystis aeruginosa K13-10]